MPKQMNQGIGIDGWMTFKGTSYIVHFRPQPQEHCDFILLQVTNGKKYNFAVRNVSGLPDDLAVMMLLTQLNA